jgi:hypothetical protein
MIQRDWEAARIAWIESSGDLSERHSREASDFLKYRNNSGEVADFHSLRHTFITLVAKSGVDPKTAKELARHSTITLAMDRYSHTELSDMYSAVERLNGLPEIQTEGVRATGTAGEVVGGSLVLPLVEQVENPCEFLRLSQIAHNQRKISKKPRFFFKGGGSRKYARSYFK